MLHDCTAADSPHSGKYSFARDNPFLGDAGAEAKGRDLFRRGVLTEAGAVNAGGEGGGGREVT